LGNAVKNAFWTCLVIWLGGAALGQLAGNEVVREICVNVFGLITIGLGIVLAVRWQLNKRVTPDASPPKIKNTEEHPPECEAIEALRLRNLNLTHQGFDFSITLSPERYLAVEFSQRHPVPNMLHPSGRQEVSGVLRIDRASGEDFRITLVLSPFDMISRNSAASDREYLEGLGANGIVFNCNQGSWHTIAELFVDPVEIDEEGWRFSFDRVLQKPLARYDLTETSAERVLKGVLTAESFTFSVVKSERTSKSEYEKTKISGATTQLVLIEFPFMNIFRDRFVQAFGQDLLERAATENGKVVAT
jgi:hypothetical protein